MNHSNTALWIIPKFDLEDFLQIILENQKDLFTFSNSPDPDQTLWSRSELFEKKKYGFSTAGYRVERINP